MLSGHGITLLFHLPLPSPSVNMFFCAKVCKVSTVILCVQLHGVLHDFMWSKEQCFDFSFFFRLGLS